MNNDNLYLNFYITRKMSLRCSDGGGPFGFDIHKALEVCYLIDKHNCDMIVETGTHTGDTTELLAKQYPNKEILTCETNREYFDIAKDRLKKYDNVNVVWESSEKVLKKINASKPFYYLDAHWEHYWPLIDELKTIRTGVVCIDDFDIKTPGYSSDTWNNVMCDKKLILDNIDVKLYINNPKALYPYPNLQKDRISGRCYFTKGIKENYFNDINWFKKH